ncbi:coiled-coil domain-containing protein 9 [Gastrophryne carolinensis]
MVREQRVARRDVSREVKGNAVLIPSLNMASVVDLKSKEEKDAELDRRIEALRKKNEALMKRHQLIEEDRKRAELEGIAVTTPRKAKSPGEPEKLRKERENFSITLDATAGEKRIVNDKSPKGPPTPPRGETSPRSPTARTSGRIGSFPGGRLPHVDRQVQSFKLEEDNLHPAERPKRERRIQGEGGSRRGPIAPTEVLPGDDQRASTPRRGRGRGQGRGDGALGRGGGNAEAVSGPDRRSKEWEEKRKQNIEKMNEEMEKIAEYERSQRDGMREKNPIRNFLDDPRRSGPIAEVDRKEGSRRHNRNWGGSDFDKVKTGMDREKESHVRRPGVKNPMDMTMSMTGRERAEYVRWKQEREQIDQERLARHRKPTGQWRREWDAEKTDTMFKDGAAPHVDEEPMGRRGKGLSLCCLLTESKRGAPKPPTMAEFLPESLTMSSQRRDHKKGRGRSKPYSMHDSRWEDDEEEEVHEKQEKKTFVEKEENSTEKPIEQEEKAEAPQKNIPEDPIPVMDEKKDEAKDDKDEDSEGEEEDDEEWTDASGEEYISEGEEHPNEEVTKDSAASPKEQRLPQRVETPKLTIPPPGVSNEEENLESKPTSPFSPEGHRPVTDWGEEMELLSPPGSSNEDSPPQVVTRKVFNMDPRSRSDSTQNPCEDPEGAMASVEGSSLHTPEIQTNQQQRPTESLQSDAQQNPDCNSRANQGETTEKTQQEIKETSSAVGETSPVPEQAAPVTIEGTEEASRGAEEMTGAEQAAHIADYETGHKLSQKAKKIILLGGPTSAQALPPIAPTGSSLHIEVDENG